MLESWPPGLFDYWLAFYAAENEPEKPAKETPKERAIRAEREQAAMQKAFGAR